MATALRASEFRAMLLMVLMVWRLDILAKVLALFFLDSVGVILS